MKKLLLFSLVFLASCTRYVYIVVDGNTSLSEQNVESKLYIPQNKGIDDGFFKLEPNFDLRLPYRIESGKFDCMPVMGIDNVLVFQFKTLDLEYA